jgi:hypothetical protein
MKNFLLILALILALLLMIFLLKSKPAPTYTAEPMAEEIITAPGFVLQKGTKLRFTLPQAKAHLQLLSNANLSLDSKNGQNNIAAYTIKYRILDASEKIITENNYTQMAIFPQVFEQNGEAIYNIFYKGEKFLPSNTDEINLNLSSMPAAKYLEVELSDHPDIIADVTLRMTHNIYNENNSPNKNWNTLSDRTKEKITHPHLFGYESLSHNEITNLIQRESTSIGPDGGNYNKRMLYYRDTSKEQPQPVLNTIFANKDLHADIPVLSSGILHLTFMPENPKAHNEIKLLIHNYREQTTTTYITKAEKYGSVFDWSGQVTSGMIEVIPEHNIVINANFTDTSGTYDITPVKLNTQSFPIGKDGLSYPINHAASEPTPIRTTLWGTGEAKNFVVSYSFFDKDNQLIKDGEIKWQGLPDYYNTVVNKGNINLLTPMDYYFLSPPNAAKLTLKSSDYILATAYNRPFAKPFMHFNPSLKDRLSNTDFAAMPNWFVLKPENVNQLVMGGDELQIAIQQPLQIINENDDENWLRHEATPPYIGHDLLEQYQLKSTYVTPPTLSAIYSPVEANVAIPMTAPQDNNPISMLFLQKENKPFEYNISQDGAAPVSGTAAGLNGEIELPQNLSSKYNITIKSPANVEWFISGIAPKYGAMSRRMAYYLPAKHPLEFIYNKQFDNDILLGNFYSQSTTQTPSKIIVKITGLSAQSIEPSPDFNPDEHIIIVTPDSTDHPVRIMGVTENSSLAGKKAFAINIGATTPNGQYKISVSLLDGSGGYLNLHSTIPAANVKGSVVIQH